MSTHQQSFSFQSTVGLIAFILLLAACTEQASEANQARSEQAIADSIALAEVQKAEALAAAKEQLLHAEQVYCIASQMSIRQEPNVASPEVVQVVLGEALRFAGVIGGDSTGVMVDDVVKIAQFAQVMTTGGQVGWIHQGAIQSKLLRTSQEEVGDSLSLTKIDPTQAAHPESWVAIFEKMGACEGTGCPKFYGNSSANFLLVEVCNSQENVKAGIHIFYPSGNSQQFDWWEETYGNAVCQKAGTVSYQVEKMQADNSSILELRMKYDFCLLYTSPSPRDRTRSRMPSSA